MGQILFDSPEVKREITRLKTFALANPIDLSNGIPEGLVPVGDQNGHVAENGNIKIVYSVEIQPTLGQCHHLSVSKTGNKPPNPAIVDYVMGQFGMGNLQDKQPRKAWIEEGFAANVVQPMVQQ